MLYFWKAGDASLRAHWGYSRTSAWEASTGCPFRVLCEKSRGHSHESCVLLIRTPQQCPSAAVEKAVQHCERFLIIYIFCVSSTGYSRISQVWFEMQACRFCMLGFYRVSFFKFFIIWTLSLPSQNLICFWINPPKNLRFYFITCSCWSVVLFKHFGTGLGHNWTNCAQYWRCLTSTKLY